MHEDRKGEARRSHRDYPSGGIRLPLTGIILEWIRGIILSKWIIWIIWGGGLVGLSQRPSKVKVRVA